MKQDDETDDSEKNINTLERITAMPHINSHDNNVNDLGSYEDFLHPRESQEDFERSQQPFKYGFFNEDKSDSVFVNVKQLGCIKKRKMRREFLDTLMIQPRNTYLHESRHRHAMKRLRAPSGRFLTKEETEEFLKNQENELLEEEE